MLQAEILVFRLFDELKIRSTGSFTFLGLCTNLLIILTLVSMESSNLVIFSTSGKFITKFNVLHCIYALA